MKGHLGGYRFRTNIQKKTLTPKWHEEFKVPIITWESNNVLVIEVRDKDHFYDDILGFVMFLNIGFCIQPLLYHFVWLLIFLLSVLPFIHCVCFP